MRARTTITNWVMALVAIALGFVAQGYFVQHEIQDALLLYAIAAGLFLWSVRGYGDLVILPPEPTHPRVEPMDPGRHSFGRWVVIGLLVLAIAAAVLALREFGAGEHMSRGWTLYLVSMGSLLASAYLADVWDERRKREGSGGGTPFLSWREGLILLLVLGVAAFMRFHRFGDWPFGTWYDEADNALHVLTMMQDPAYRPVFVPSTNLPAHFLYLILFAFELFGPTTESIRLVTATMGVATIFAGYLFGREFLGRQMALVLAFLLAVSRWDVTFSRIGLHGVSTPLFELLVLYFVLRGLRTRSRIDFAWAGLLTGLGLCFYATFRLFPFVVLLFLLHQLLVDGRKFWHRHGINLAVLVIAALIAFAPVVQYAIDHREAFWARTDRVSIFKTAPEGKVWPTVLSNAGSHLLMFNYRGDPNGRHNLPGEPMLDYATSALAVIGLVYALSRSRSPRYSLLVFWFSIMLLGGILSLPFEAPQSLRAIGTLPVAYVLAVLPIGLIRLETMRVFVRKGRLMFGVGLVVLLGWIGWNNYHTYFQVQARNYASWMAYSTVETAMSEELNHLDPGYDTYFAEVLTNHLTTRFLAPEAGQQTPFDPTEHLPFRRSGEKGVVVFLDQESFDTVDILRFYYPELEVRYLAPPFGGRDFLALAIVEREQIESVQGLPARYHQEDGGNASAIYRQDATLSFEWPGDAPLEFPFQVEWHGVLVAPTYGRYGMRVVGPSRSDVQVRLDRSPLLGGTEPMQRDVMLARGRHDLHVRARVDGPGTFEFQWRPLVIDENLDEWSAVPREVLYGPPVTADGLVGRYFPNASWEGPAELVRIDPEISFYFHLIPLKRPYSVEWRGQLDVREAGRYVFGVQTRDAAYLYVDNELLLPVETPDAYYERATELAAGRHDVSLRFLDETDHSHVYLYWIPPGGNRDIIPFNHLAPAVGDGWEPVD